MAIRLNRTKDVFTRLRPFLCAACLWCAAGAAADVFDLTVTDVTTRAFSVVWVSNEPVTGATVRVYADANGTTELTGGLIVTGISQDYPPALGLGVVKVQVAGLAANTCYYYQTETTASATVISPPTAPLLEVCTELESRRSNSVGLPITNDVLTHDVLHPDGTSPATGTLVLLEVPGVSSYPLSTFVGEGATTPASAVDLSNVFEIVSGTNAELSGGEPVMITEYRSLLCAGLASHKLVRFRRVPLHEEIASLPVPITEFEPVAACFEADTVCDGVVDILDVQRVLNLMGQVSGECAFNIDLDVIANGTIEEADAQSVLDRLNETEPFSP